MPKLNTNYIDNINSIKIFFKKYLRESMVYNLLYVEDKLKSLIKEKENMVKVSLRSRDKVDVRKIAELFGGGGHTKASGFAVKMSSMEIKEKLEEILS